MSPPPRPMRFLIGSPLDCRAHFSRGTLQPIANRRISVALVASLAPRLLWHCMAGDAGWAYLFRRTADVSIWISAAHAPTHLGPQGGGGCYKGGGGLPNPPTEIQIPLSPTTHEKRATREPVQGNLRTGDLKSHLLPFNPKPMFMDRSASLFPRRSDVIHLIISLISIHLKILSRNELLLYNL